MSPREMVIRETPEEAQQRSDMQRVRLENGVKVAADGAQVMEPFDFTEPITFRFRKILNTQFVGLWELAVVNKHGKIEEIVSDADALPNLLEAIGNIFQNRGF